MATIGGSHGRYGDALRIGQFRALFCAVSLSITGTSVTAVALTVLVYQRTSSPFLSSLTFALGFLPYLIGGVFLSALVDRIAPSLLLTGCDLGCAVLVAAMAWPEHPFPRCWSSSPRSVPSPVFRAVAVGPWYAAWYPTWPTSPLVRCSGSLPRSPR